jgi:hypothetical protein
VRRVYAYYAILSRAYSVPEFMVSTLPGWRALRAAPQRILIATEMAQEGFEPSASLVLSESGLPVAYRASDISSEGWNRTSGLHVQSVALLPAATAPESSENPIFTKTFSQFHGFYESHGFGHFIDAGGG